MIVSNRDAIASPLPPTLAELRRIAAGHDETSRCLINRWETPIRIIASGFASRRSDLDDLRQVGRQALFQCASRFNVARGIPFSHYAKRAIKNSVRQQAARLARQRKLESPRDSNRLDDSTEPAVHNGNADLQFSEWLQRLAEPHATIFRVLYVEGMTQREAGRAIGVSQPRIAQLHQAFLSVARLDLTS